MEAAVLGGYAKRASPSCTGTRPCRASIAARGCSQDARRLRARDRVTRRSSARINTGAPRATGEGASGWGDLSAHWDGSSFRGLRSARQRVPRRAAVWSARWSTPSSSSYRDVAQGSGEAFVPLDEGLADSLAPRPRPRLRRAGAVSRRADPVARDARCRSASSSTRKAPRSSKLVEAQTAGRPIPDNQLRGATARSARAGGRAGDGRGPARLRRRPAVVGSPLRADHAGRPATSPRSPLASHAAPAE